MPDSEPAPLFDTGLGVPPRPPATPPLKDPMGRTNFGPPATTPIMGNPPMPPSAPPRPPGMPAPRPSGFRDSLVVPERRTLVVGRGISVQGVVQDAECLVVEGRVEATLLNASALEVRPGGLFKGEIEVEDAEVAGTVDGSVVARGNLIVRATGVVVGVARCRRLQVEDGGQITGRIEMITEGPKPQE